MTSAFQVLIIEDTPNDAELICRALEKGLSVDFEITRVEDRPSFEATLAKKTWDLVLSDFNLIDLNGFEVLERLQRYSPTTPFIVISGAIGEEAAADLLRAGAKDFISKNNFSRLVPAVQRELNESRQKKRFLQLESKLRETEQSLKVVVDSVKDHAIFMIDMDRRIVSWNAGAERITGYSEAEMIGKSMDLLYLPEECREGIPAQEFSRALDGLNLQSEGWRVHKSGARFWSSGSWTILRAESGAVQGFAQIMRDETDRKRFQEELENARAKAEAANAAKSQFLANMSHEIRTPLGIILGFAELIAAGVASETALGHAQRILKNGKQLSRLIDDILDVSKIEANCLEIEKVEISLRETLEEAISVLQLKSEIKGLSLRLEIDPELNDRILTDPVRLRQVLLNIVGNAVKFTSSGEVVVQVRPSDTSADQLRILVRDTGKGIPEKAVERLFLPFSQGEVSVNRRYGGTGLGLYLSRQLCQALGGDLKLLETTEGMGSTFEITMATHAPGKLLPESQPSPAEGLRTRLPGSCPSKLAAGDASAQSIAGSRILIIDDSPDNCMIFQFFLESAGARVEIAENGIDGIRKAVAGSYDLIFLDIQMPVLDGYQVLSQLRERGIRNPIIALTAHALESERQKCLAAGFNDHVAKPASRQDLVQAVCKQMAPLQPGSLMPTDFSGPMDSVSIRKETLN